MPTLRDVAILAGVSTATVSHVVNNTRRITPETRARVERAIAQIGFTPNPVGRLLALQKNGTNLNAPRLPDALPELRPIKPEAYDAERAIGSWRAPHGMAPAPAGYSSSTARAMLKIIRAAQPISRADLARRLDVNRSTVTEIVKPLLASGVLREGEPQQATTGRTGRPPIGLSLCTGRAFFIGVNIGVRRTQVGIAGADGQMLDEDAFDTLPDAAATLAQIRAIIERLRTRLPERAQTFIGVSIPSPTDAARTRLLYAPHLGWRDVDIAAALRMRDTLGTKSIGRDVPVVVENDSSAAAMYEARRRLRSSTDGSWGDFILVRAGTGIGVGLVLGGEVYRGTGVGGGLAGEFGHMTIVAGGKPCVCGNRGCWERYASASSAASLYTGDRPLAHKASAPRFAEIVSRAEAGERRAQATLERIGEYLGIGIGNVIGGLGIPRVVVSGRVVLGWRFIEGSLREALARTMAGRLSPWSVEPGEPTGAGLGGALEVAIDEYLTTLSTQIKAAA
jgi:predicted NBD/HSP70 family sugar kinase/plasmid maintenance system antidote protein VapI